MSEPQPQSGIAVLIPVLNEASCIARLLNALTAMDFAEIVVADGGSTDATVEIARSFPKVTVVASPRGRGHQINAAVQASSQPLLLILHADTSLPEAAPRLIRETLQEGKTAAGCFRLRFDSAMPMLKLFAWFSRFETQFTTFGDQAYFLTRRAFEASGGAPAWPFLEDVVLRQRLKSQGAFVKRREYVVTSARRFEKRGPVRGQLRNVLIILGYGLGVPIERLAAFYEAW